MPQPTREAPPPEIRFPLVLEEALRDAMQKLARRNDRSLSAEMRQALREYVERNQNGKDS